MSDEGLTKSRIVTYDYAQRSCLQAVEYDYGRCCLKILGPTGLHGITPYARNALYRRNGLSVVSVNFCRLKLLYECVINLVENVKGGWISKFVYMGKALAMLEGRDDSEWMSQLTGFWPHRDISRCDRVQMLTNLYEWCADGKSLSYWQLAYKVTDSEMSSHFENLVRGFQKDVERAR